MAKLTASDYGLTSKEDIQAFRDDLKNVHDAETALLNDEKNIFYIRPSSTKANMLAVDYKVKDPQDGKDIVLHVLYSFTYAGNFHIEPTTFQPKPMTTPSIADDVPRIISESRMELVKEFNNIFRKNNDTTQSGAKNTAPSIKGEYAFYYLSSANPITIYINLDGGKQESKFAYTYNKENGGFLDINNNEFSTLAEIQKDLKDFIFAKEKAETLCCHLEESPSTEAVKMLRETLDNLPNNVNKNKLSLQAATALVINQLNTLQTVSNKQHQEKKKNTLGLFLGNIALAIGPECETSKQTAQTLSDIEKHKGPR